MVPVIISGGLDTSLWPLSRKVYPKQFHPLIGELSLLQNTAKRVSRMEGAMAPIFVCNEEHRFILAEQLRSIGIAPQKIILEPFGRNTAPAVALAAFSLLHNDPPMLVSPCDHYIADEEAFNKAVKQGAQLAEQGKLVTFGASGIFLVKPSTYLEELKKYAPEIYDCANRCIAEEVSDLDFTRIDKDLFASCPSVSIDTAIPHGVVIPVSCGWSDVSSWKTIWSLSNKDAGNNVAIGDVRLEQVQNCLVRSEEKLIVATGVKNLSIIETDDAILVSKIDDDNHIKKVIADLSLEKRPEVDIHRKVYRPWGAFVSLQKGERHQVKKIIVNPGCKLSLQYHNHRSEHWVVVKGKAKVTKGNEEFFLRENESTYIPQGELHRLENTEMKPLELIEVQTGSYLGEDDIVRLEDQYNR